MFKRWIKRFCMLGVLSSIGLTAQTVNAEDSTIKVGVLQYVEHNALDASREGFMDRLEESEYGDRIEFDVQNASGNQTTLQSIGEKLARDNDILYAIATPAAVSLAGIEQEKPIFFGAVTDPVTAGLVDSLEKPGRNVTGISDRQPLEKQVDLLIRNFPDAKKIGLIYNSSEVNSQVQAEEAIRLLEDKGLETVEATVVSTNDIAQTLNALIEDVDALFMVTDNTIDSAITLVGDVAKEHNVPTIGSSGAVVEQNGLATISTSYYDSGKQAAEMVIQMLDEELKPAEMPVELGKDVELVVNEDFAKAIGVDPSTIK